MLIDGPVKAFRALASGEDSELKDAYERFHRMVAREEGLVRNAILSNTEKTNTGLDGIHRDVNQSLTVSKQTNSMVESVADRMQDMQITLRGNLDVHDYITCVLLKLSVTEQETASERENILKWFSEHDFRQIQLDVFSQHHKDTGYWLLDHPFFQTWFKGDENTTLWCPGIRKIGQEQKCEMYC